MGNHKRLPTRVRLPVLEGVAVHGAGILVKSKRKLTVQEEKVLEDIFKSSIDYGAIEVATTNIGAQGRPYTLGNLILVPPKSDFNTRTLVHETAHVWQYQTKGSGYISDSVWHQVTDKSAYKVSIVADQPLSRYTAEQQAVIVEAYYVDKHAAPSSPATSTEFDPSQVHDPPLGWSLLPDVKRMISEVQRARPMTEEQRLDDRLFGPGSRPLDVPGDRKVDPVVPILRIEFDFL